MDAKAKRKAKQPEKVCLRCGKTVHRRGLCTGCYLRFHRLKAAKAKKGGPKAAAAFDRDNIAAGTIAAPRVAKPETHFVGA